MRQGSSEAAVGEAGLKTGAYTFDEIYHQAQICQETLRQADERFQHFQRVLPLSTYTDILLTGCGSSLHLACCARSAWAELLGRPVRAAPASELLHFSHITLSHDAHPLVFALSRTGGTTETVRAASHLRQRYAATTVAVSTEPNSEMGRACDIEFAFPECREQSVVMTGSFTAILYGLLLWADQVAEGKHRDALSELPSLLNQAIIKSERICQQIASDRRLRRFVFLGSGPMLGVAHEAALKLTEMALEPASTYPTLEFRHGPIAALDADTLVTVFPVETELPYLPTLVKEVAETGAKLVVVSHSSQEFASIQLSFETGLHEVFRPLLYNHVGQLLGFWRAVEHGRNPDTPPHLRRTVTLDD